MAYNIPKSIPGVPGTPTWKQDEGIASVTAVAVLKTWLVGPTGTYTTLSQAIANVSDGDRILLESNYVVDASTPIVIDKDITIEGGGSSKSVIQNVSGTPATLFDLRAKNVYLKNLAFTAHSSGNCLGSTTSASVNLFCTECSFSGPSSIFTSGNNIQFSSCTFVKTDSNLSRVSLKITSSGNSALGGNGKIINIESCTFQDFSANLSHAIQIDLGAGSVSPIRIDDLSYAVNPHDTLLAILMGASADSAVRVPFWITSNNTGSGNALVRLVGANAVTPLLLDNFPSFYITGNSISNSSGYGFITCERTGPGTIDLGNGAADPFIYSSSNTATNPSTVRAGYAAGTIATESGNEVLLTYDTAKFNAYSKSPASSAIVGSILIPSPVPCSSNREIADEVLLSKYDTVLCICDWNAVFSGRYTMTEFSPVGSWSKILEYVKAIFVENGLSYSGTFWNGDDPSQYRIKYVENSWFGSGANGAGSVIGTTTLTSDMYYTNLFVQSTGILKTNGYRVYVSGILSISPGGLISMDGASATSVAAAAGYTGAGSLAITSGGGGSGGFSGASPISPVAGGSPSNVTPYFVGVTATTFEGGKGSTGAVAGGNGGTVPTATTSLGGFESPLDLQAGYAVKSGNPFNGGAGGGGGGYGSGAGNDGGGGGAGGGGVWIAARRIANFGKITANGGKGGPGTGTGAGGGGGGGGWVALTYAQGDVGFITAKAGSPGAGGVASTAAVDGKVYLKLV